jgi:hypothetical protein
MICRIAGTRTVEECEKIIKNQKNIATMQRSIIEFSNEFKKKNNSKLLVSVGVFLDKWNEFKNYHYELRSNKLLNIDDKELIYSRATSLLFYGADLLKKIVDKLQNLEASESRDALLVEISNV